MSGPGSAPPHPHEGVSSYGIVKTAAQTPCGADEPGAPAFPTPTPTQKLISLYPGGQGTLCPIDPRPDESFQFSFKFSWAALHRPACNPAAKQAHPVPESPCVWVAGRIAVVEAGEHRPLCLLREVRAPGGRVSQSSLLFQHPSPVPPMQDASDGGFGTIRFRCSVHPRFCAQCVRRQTLCLPCKGDISREFSEGRREA